MKRLLLAIALFAIAPLGHAQTRFYVTRTLHEAVEGATVSIEVRRTGDGLEVEGVAFTLTSSEATPGVDWTRAGGSPEGGALSFAAGELSKTVQLHFVDDELFENTGPATVHDETTITAVTSNGSEAMLTNAFRYYSPFEPNGGCSGKTRSVRR